MWQGPTASDDDPFHHHPGRSLIVDYMGEVIADAGEKETVINATLNTDHLAEYRKGLPFLQDIRPDFLTSDSMKF